MGRLTQGRFHRRVQIEGAQAPALLDAAQLDRQTGGDAVLAAEVLALFAEQARAARAALDNSAAGALSTAMHRLKGSARAVGAFAIAERAATLEKEPNDNKLRQALAETIDGTLDAIARLKPV